MSIDNVLDIEPRDQYTASASQTNFTYSFPIFDDGDLVVYDNDTLMVLTTDYTVSGAGDDNGGTVTFLVGRTAGHIITIYRDIPIERTSDMQQNGPWTSQSVNDEFDKAYTILQELKAKIGRAIRWPFTASQTNAGLELSPISNWMNRYLYVNASGVLEAAASIVTTTLSQSVIAQLLNPQTADEAGAGLAVVNYLYAPGRAERYQNYVDSTTDFSVGIQAAMTMSQYVEGTLTKGRTYRVNSNLVWPGAHGLRFDGKGSSTLNLYSTGTCISHTLVGGTTYPVECDIRGFQFFINDNPGGIGWKVRVSYSKIDVDCAIRSTSNNAWGFEYVGDEANGTGPYYSDFNGDVQGQGTGQVGHRCTAVAPAYRGPNANVWHGRAGQLSIGWLIQGCGNLLDHPIAESCTNSFYFAAGAPGKTVGNDVDTFYVENATTAFTFLANTDNNGAYGGYITGVSTFWSDLGTNNFYVGANDSSRLPLGVRFGAANADPTVLDAYGEGVFTPGLTFATPGTLATTAGASNSGSYTRIGNRVFFDTDLDLSVLTLGTASGALRITGLPTPAAAGDPSTCAMGFQSAALAYAASRTYITPQVIAGQSYIEFSQHGTGVATTTLAVAQVTGGSGIRLQISGSYRV